jgi:putative PIN family toxin of toxin-antitoxin system
MKLKQPRVTIDTNLIVSGLIASRGGPFELIEAWRASRFSLVMTPELRAEYENVLLRPVFSQRFGLRPVVVLAFLAAVDQRAEFVSQSTTLPVDVRDVRDRHVLAAALALGGQCEFLVTGDKDLLVLADEPKLAVLSILQVEPFLRRLAELQSAADE